MKFKDYLREIRIKDNLTQNNLAELLGISLAAVKKIEAGNTEYPSSKVLEALAKYLNINQVEVMRDLLFDKGDNEKAIHSFLGDEDEMKDLMYAKENQAFIEEATDTLNLLQKYVAFMFINGWNVASYFPCKEMDRLDDEYFGAELTSKRMPSYNMIIDTIFKYIPHKLDVNDINDNKALLSMLLVTMTQIKSKVKTYSILFNANDDYELNFYRNVKVLCIRNFKVKIQFVLFDGIECKVIEEKDVCVELED